MISPRIKYKEEIRDIYKKNKRGPFILLRLIISKLLKWIRKEPLTFYTHF